MYWTKAAEHNIHGPWQLWNLPYIMHVQPRNLFVLYLTIHSSMWKTEVNATVDVLRWPDNKKRKTALQRLTVRPLCYRTLPAGFESTRGFMRTPFDLQSLLYIRLYYITHCFMRSFWCIYFYGQINISAALYTTGLAYIRIPVMRESSTTIFSITNVVLISIKEGDSWCERFVEKFHHFLKRQTKTQFWWTWRAKTLITPWSLN